MTKVSMSVCKCMLLLLAATETTKIWNGDIPITPYQLISG